jgi:hypothetical protein
MINAGITGMIIPNPMTSTRTVIKINPNAALPVLAITGVSFRKNTSFDHQILLNLPQKDLKNPGFEGEVPLKEI